MRRHLSFSMVVVIISLTIPSLISAGVINLPRTGQTKCYDSSGQEIACGGTGQDGETQKGVEWPNPRFTVSGDCVIDNLTGLMWARNGNLPNDTKTWQQALDYISELNSSVRLCGYTDWRLPNILELNSLVHTGQGKSYLWLMSQGFIDMKSGDYWSSTTKIDNKSYAWTLHTWYDFIYGYEKKYRNYVLPVRSGQANILKSNLPIRLPKTGQTGCYNTIGTEINCSGTGQDGETQKGVTWPNPRFIVSGDCVIDNLTGLMWARNGNLTGGAKKWQNILDFIINLNNSGGLCGYTDWRLPNINELFSLGHLGQESISDWLNTQGFTNLQSSHYWSSSSFAVTTSTAWYFNMWRGSKDMMDKTLYEKYAIPVRDTQSITLFSLNLSKLGTGSGVVTSSPAGINCGSSCNASFDAGTSVTLTASANRGSDFAGWGGDCNGLGVCTLMMNSTKNVTATFNLTPCSYIINPSIASFAVTGGSGSVEVINSGCSWTATSNNNWITITSGNSGTGSGTITYTVDSNSGTYRIGTITIGNQTHTVTQSDTAFADVNSSMWSKNYIIAIFNNGITVGCIQSPIRYYCPSSSTSRGEMAVFIIRAKYGNTFFYPTTPYFSDVPPGHPYFSFIQRLKYDGITSLSGTFRVNDPVLRGEMAAFIIRARYGDTFFYPTTPYFSDVPSSNTYFMYVQRLKYDNTTTQTGIYRVNDVVSREEMAAFLSRAFLGMQ